MVWLRRIVIDVLIKILYMKKKLFKYTIRIVLGLFTLLWGLVAWAALYPDESYHHCESEQEEMSATTCVIIVCASLLMFCLVWYATMDKRTANEKSPQ